jgi:hypothetical protein
MYNLDVRLAIKQNRLCHYEVAKKVGISEATLCRWLREELSEDKRNIILKAISDIIGGDK